MCASHRYIRDEPLWYFGHGESYATFSYSTFKVHSLKSGVCDTVDVSVTVTRIAKPQGKADHLPADEIVQLYVATEPTDPSGVAPLARLRLCDFTRLHDLTVGESREVRFKVTPSDVAVVNPVGRVGWELRAGAVRFWIGGRQPTIDEVATGPRSGQVNGLQTATVSIDGSTTPLANCTSASNASTRAV